MTGSWLFVLDLSVFAVGDLGDEDASVDHRVKTLRLLSLFGAIILTWSRVLSWWVKLVLNIDRRFKHLSRLLRRLEVTDGSSSF